MVDELSGPGQDQAPDKRPRYVLVALLLVLLVAGLVADLRRHERELDGLLRRIASAEQVIRASQASLASLTDYQSALLVRADAPPAARAAAYDNLARDAARWAPQVRASGEQVEDVRLLPWHDRLERTQAAYERRVSAWSALLERTRADPAAGLDGRGDVSSALEQARLALTEAVDGDTQRVRAVLG